MSFWKPLLPGWFAAEWDYENEMHSGDDEGDGDGGGGGGGGDDRGDGGGGGGGGHDDEGDGDGGSDYSWQREQQREQEDRDREREQEERRREEERRRQEEERRRREEEERQRQIEEERRRIEEENRRMQEEQDRRNRENAAQQQQDLDGDGVPDAGTSPVDQQSQDISQALDEQFQRYEEQRQEQEANFDPNSPDWIYKDEQGNDTRPLQLNTGQGFATNDPQEMDQWLAERNSENVRNRAMFGGPYTPASSVRDIQPAEMPEPPAPQPSTTDVPRVAAEAAATAAARAGGTPEQVARTAEAAARIASDRQTLAQQSPWTRAMFRGEYGANAEQEWVRQHEAELRRNQQLYGSREPRAGAAPVVGAPAGTPVAPNRRIGATPAPRAGEDARYGINTPALPAAPAVAARTAPPGSPTVQAAGTPPAAPPQTPVGGGLSPADQAEMDQATARPVAAPTSLVPRPPQPLPTNPGGLSPADQREMDQAVTPRGGGLSPLDQAEMDQAAAPRPTTGGLSPSDQAEMDQAATNYRPPAPTPYVPPGQAETPGPYQTQPAAYDERGNPIEYIQGRPTPIRNIVDYDPVTGQTRERNYGVEQMASTDTSVRPLTPPEGVAPGDAGLIDDPVRNLIDSDRPLDALAALAGQAKGPEYDASRDAYHIAQGISAMLRGDSAGTWAEPYLNDVARLAWARQERDAGRVADPRNTPIEYVEKWKDAFYGSDHNVPFVKEIDQQMIDYAAERTPAGKPFNWKEAFGQNGDKGLISRQVTEVDCGTNAFSTILRSRGYNADPAQTFVFGKRTGYHNGSEFTGPDNMVRMLREEAGLNATSADISPNGQGWQKVDAELAAGRPVILSSPGHYWVISAKNEQGQYYAGATTLKGNPEWMARGGFVYGGAANRAIFADGDVDPQSRSVREMQLRAPATGRSASTRPLLSGQTQFGPTIATGSVRNAAASPASEAGPDDYTNYLRWSANRKGIDPDQVSAVMGKEGPEGWSSVGRFNTGTSYGPLQLHYAGGPNPQAGMGDRFTKLTGIDLRTVDPNTPEGLAAHKKAIDFALDELSKTGDYREWYGADNAFPGRGRFTPVKRLPQRGAYTSPAERASNRIYGEMLKSSENLPDFPGDVSPTTGTGGRPPTPDETPAWFAEANPDAGQMAGEGRGRDVGARLWTNAYQISQGDPVFADVVSGIVNGEAGFAGVKDERGATGLFQMDPAGGWQQLDRYLKENDIPLTRDQAARDVDIMSDFYVKKLYGSYQRARAAGYTDPEDLTVQTVIYQWNPKDEPGAAHNAGIDGIPSLERNYREGYRQFKEGVFRMLPRNRW